MAFTTVTGSNGVTSLVGTTGVDTATIVALESNSFIAGNTGNDIINLDLGTAGQIASNYEVRMGGGEDTFELNNVLLDSFVELDGLTADNSGDDTFTGNSELIVNSEIRGMGGDDAFTNLALSSSTVNGNAGDDTIGVVASSTSFVYGGQGEDEINVTANSAEMTINGNKGDDVIRAGNLAAITFTGSVYGGAGDDTITTNVTIAAATDTGAFFSGDLGDDNITATGGVDTINGGDGDDIINAGAGADVIDGGAGVDQITGAAGADVMTGGAGNDRFILAALTDAVLTSGTSNTGFDTITDFTANTEALAADIDGDRIQVGGAIGTLGAASSRAGTTNLATDLLAEVTFAGAARDVDLVTITGDVAWAGNYVVVNGAADATYDFAADAVIKIDSFAGITAEAFNLA